MTEKSSLFQYCVHELKLSEAVTSAFITVSRKAAVIPPLMEALETQALTVSKAAKITSALDIQHVEETNDVIEFASQHSTAETEKWLREKKGIETVHNLKLDSATMAKLKKAPTLTKQSLTLEQTLALVLDEYIDRHDPLEKAKRRQKRKDTGYPVRKTQSKDGNILPTAKPPASGTITKTQVVRSVTRRPLPAQIKHFVIQRDQNRCTYEIRPGLRCAHTKNLEIHHRTPLQNGGTDNPENLGLLCSAHHQMAHRH
ncbi:MAG: HNH endonuclease [Bdellovibrionaceae bacterium]|nr:HNH endonuclease [Pseudobdellovibrionaceae bacterium]